MNRVEIEEAWGGTLVRATDVAGTEHRFWFDQTDKGRVVLCAYIVYVSETDYRDYIPMHKWTVPDEVKDALIDHGLDAHTVLDLNGFEL